MQRHHNYTEDISVPMGFQSQDDLRMLMLLEARQDHHAETDILGMHQIF